MQLKSLDALLNHNASLIVDCDMIEDNLINELELLLIEYDKLILEASKTLSGLTIADARSAGVAQAHIRIIYAQAEALRQRIVECRNAIDALWPKGEPQLRRLH